MERTSARHLIKKLAIVSAFLTCALCLLPSALTGPCPPRNARPAGFLVQDRRRADQCRGDRDRRERTVRLRTSEGGFHRLRRRQAADGFAVRCRAGAGEPRHRARHERQHDRREDRRGASGVESLSRRSARAAGRSVSLSLRHPSGARARVDGGSPGGQPRARHGAAARRHGDVRHGRRGAADGAGGHRAARKPSS